MGEIEKEFLNRCRVWQDEVTIFLRNGYQFRAKIQNFDSGAVFALAGGRQQLILRDAISTIEPSRPVMEFPP